MKQRKPRGDEETYRLLHRREREKDSHNFILFEMIYLDNAGCPNEKDCRTAIIKDYRRTEKSEGKI